MKNGLTKGVTGQKSFSYKLNMKIHVKRVHNGEKALKTITCLYCDRQFSGAHMQIIHIRTIHENKCQNRKCSICDNTNINIKGTKFQCDICNRGFRLPCQLKLHFSSVHNRTTNYECDICNKEYPTVKLFTTHYNEVHEERQHKCDICPNKMFARK